jgi:hypothetical protein
MGRLRFADSRADLPRRSRFPIIQGCHFSPSGVPGSPKGATPAISFSSRRKAGGFTVRSSSASFQSVAGRAGLPADRRHPHCLKHALGFALVASKVNLAIVKQALEHKNIASTAIYAVPTDEQTGRAVNVALAGLFQAAEAWTVVGGSSRRSAPDAMLRLRGLRVDCTDPVVVKGPKLRILGQRI